MKQQQEKLRINTFTIASKTKRYLGMNLRTEIKDLYAENYRKLMKEVEKDTKK